MSNHDDWPSLTPHQLAYLKRCNDNTHGVSSDVGAATVSSLRKLGYIERLKAMGVTVNVITEAGRVALARGR